MAPGGKQQNRNHQQPEKASRTAPADRQPVNFQFKIYNFQFTFSPPVCSTGFSRLVSDRRNAKTA